MNRQFEFRRVRDFKRVFAFDCETFLIAPGLQVPRGVCLSYVVVTEADTTTEPELLHFVFDRSALHDLIRNVLLDHNTAIVGANVAFDLAVVANEFPDLLPLVFDAYDRDRIYCVQVAQRLIDIATNCLNGRFDERGQWVKHEYSLAGLVRRYFGEDLDKGSEDSWRLKYHTLIDVPCDRWPREARQYSLLDSLSTFGVFCRQVEGTRRLPALPVAGAERELSADELLCDVWNQTRAQWWLHLMVARGIRTDPLMVAKLRDLVKGEMDRLLPQLVAAKLVDVDKSKRNVKVARDRMLAVCAARGVEAKVTDKGTVQVDEEACLDSGDPSLIAFAAYTSLSTILSKDIPALEKPIIQSRFETIVETGRTSCSGGSGGRRKRVGTPAAWGYQLQNVRRKLGISEARLAELGLNEDTIGVRQCFVPRDGYYFVSCDYSMQELCSWAQVSYTLCGMTKLRDALNSGRDVHLSLGARLLGMGYEEAVERKKEVRVKEARQMAKAGNFGFPGGLSWRSFKAYAKSSYGLVLSDEQARKILCAWEEEWEPEPYFRMVSKLTENGGGEIVHLFSGRRRAWVPYTVGCNSFFQGLAADCSKDAGYRIARACYVDRSSPLYGSRIVNFIHDEFILEVPVSLAHEAAHECARLMMEAGRRWMPDCPPKVEPALMTRWIKSAEPKYENGRLVPWA